MRSCHPDKNSAEKVLGGIKEILLNKDAKALYDYGGKINEEGKISLDIQPRLSYLPILIIESWLDSWGKVVPKLPMGTHDQRH